MIPIDKNKLEKNLALVLEAIGELGHFNESKSSHHIWRMADYVYFLAQKMGWTTQQSKLLELASLLHDTGKIRIDQSILNKSEKLDESDWRIIKKHTILGHKILSKTDSPLFKLAAEIALNHHEKWDGTGYPKGLKGEKIPLSARIVAVADVLDSSTSKKIYKPALEFEEAIIYIEEGGGKHFDPKIVNIFISSLPEIKNIYESWKNKEKILS